MSTPSPSAPGYLWVLSEPGSEATVDEFQGASSILPRFPLLFVFFDATHSRLTRKSSAQTGTTTSTSPFAWRSTLYLSLLPFQARSHAFPPSISEFLTGARYVADDSLLPGYSAAYDISSVALFSDDKYTRLRANRSPREGALVARLGVLDRRTAQTLGQTSPPPEAKDAPRYVLTAASEEKPEEGELEIFKGTEGWRRSHYHHIYDSLVIGHGKEAESNVAPKYVVIHGAFRFLSSHPLPPTFPPPSFSGSSFILQPLSPTLRKVPRSHSSVDSSLLPSAEFDSPSYTTSPAYAQATNGKTEVRRWKLYKATPNTASK